jgi:glycosidase
LLNHYRWLIQLRKSEPALLKGKYTHASSDGWLISFRRETDTETVLVVINYHENAARARVTDLPANKSIQRLGPHHTDTFNTGTQGQLNPVLPGTSFAVFKWRN